MSDDKSKQDKPEEDDFKIINPPNVLQNKVKKAQGTLDDLLKNADKMLSSIQSEFDTLMEQDIARLKKVYNEIWKPTATREKAVAEFAQIANHVKGKAGSFGFALLGQIADLFRDYLDDTLPADQKAAAVLSYIDSMQVVWGQKISGDGGAIGKAIVADLSKLNEKAASGPR